MQALDVSCARRTSSHGDPIRVERDMDGLAVLVQRFVAPFACDQHHVTKLCTVRSHRLQCLPSASLWSVDGVGSTCGSPCRCMRGSQQCDAEHAALRSQRQGPAAPRIGCVYGHGAMPKPLGGPRGGEGAWGRISKSGPHGVTRHALQHVQRGTPCPLSRGHDSPGCLELTMTGIRSGDRWEGVRGSSPRKGVFEAKTQRWGL
jgi:hypothetical protein